MCPKIVFLVFASIASVNALSATVSENPKPTNPLEEKQQADTIIRNILFVDTPTIHECVPTTVEFHQNATKYNKQPLWTVVIIEEVMCGNKTLLIQKCSGSLIHKQVVLTAAHCIYNKSLENLRIRAGVSTKQSNANDHIDRQIESFAILPKYDPIKPKMDMALLFLKTPFEITAHVNTVCTVPGSVQLDIDYVNCFITGWQRQGHISQGYANFRQLNMTVIPNQNCENALQLTGLGEQFNLHKSFICASGNFDKTALNANGGAPLVCRLCDDSDRIVQVGVMSWGFSDAPMPEVFTSVRKARRWLTEKFTEKNLKFPACGFPQKRIDIR